MKIRNLDTFYWVASLGSFRAAAEKLNVTQPAISARIQVLEQDLGARVFFHELKNAELTPAGRQLFGFAERFIYLEQELLLAFADQAAVAQTIRVGASETLVCSWLPEFMGSFAQNRHGVSFDLRVDATDHLRNALVAREIDLAFLMGPVAEVSICNHPLCDYEMVFAATPSIAAEQACWSAAQITQHTLLTFATNTKPYRQIKALLTQDNLREPKITTSTSLGAMIRLATSGMGICALPAAVITQELAQEQLAVLPTELALPRIAFTASYVASSPNRLLLAQITEQVLSYLQPYLIKNIYHSQ